MRELDGHVAVVTGGGRGIGRAIAVELAAAGATIVVSSRTKDELDAVVDEARRRGSDGRAVACDAMVAAEAKRPVAAAVEEFGQVDVLVNNVGGSTGGNLDPFEGDDASFEAELTLNLVSAYWTTREALPHMRARSYGRIVNIGSGASKRAAANPAYTAAKHGVVGLTKALAAATARYGITVNCLCPGWTNTSLLAAGRARGGPDAEARQRARAEADNLQHRILEPEELGPMALLLASPRSAGITGQTISVDGGYRV